MLAKSPYQLRKRVHSLAVWACGSSDVQSCQRQNVQMREACRWQGEDRQSSNRLEVTREDDFDFSERVQSKPVSRIPTCSGAKFRCRKTWAPKKQATSESWPMKNLITYESRVAR